MNIKLVCEYDGTLYSGFQKQPDRITVQGAIEESIGRCIERTSPVYPAGRTDAGVHARNQVINFHAETSIPDYRIADAINASLPNDIAIKSSERVKESFNARHDAKTRTYAYYFLIGKKPVAIGRQYCFQVKEFSELEEVSKACEVLKGEHDFSAFCSREERGNRVRTVYDISCRKRGAIAAVSIQADGFLNKMVRMICGSLYMVGRGRWSAERIAEVLESKDSVNCANSLPPQGLFLEHVDY